MVGNLCFGLFFVVRLLSFRLSVSLRFTSGPVPVLVGLADWLAWLAGWLGLPGAGRAGLMRCLGLAGWAGQPLLADFVGPAGLACLVTSPALVELGNTCDGVVVI